MQWWAAGCRTLEDLREGRCGVKLNPAQEIGLHYYDGEPRTFKFERSNRSSLDINSRMPREEAKAIFEIIKKIGTLLFLVMYANSIQISLGYRPQALRGNNG